MFFVFRQIGRILYLKNYKMLKSYQTASLGFSLSDVKTEIQENENLNGLMEQNVAVRIL